MRHAILGNGNLGNSLAKEFVKRNHEFHIFSASTDWKYPSEGLIKIHDYLPDHVWTTVGAGSVEQANTNFVPFSDLHIRLPMELAQSLNAGITLHLFSTDYCAVPAQSLYALSKQCMEEAVQMTGRAKTYIYRVGSLYGTNRPQKCFPYKIKKASLNKKIKLPLNCVSPTPVDWLAKTLVDAIDTDTFKPLSPTLVCPKDCVTVKGWGELILGEELEMKEFPNGLNSCSLRPLGCVHHNANEISISNLSQKEVQPPTWLELWKEREEEWQKIFQGMV